MAGILGSTPQKSADAAHDLGCSKGYSDLEDLLADDDIDCVHVTSPNRFHFQQTCEILKAGKHVMCEKPLAMNTEQSRELVQLAADADCVAGVAYNIRFYPLCHEAAARIQNGDLGRTLHVTGTYVQDWLLHETDYNWRVSSKDGGALRAVADIGTHWLDLVQFITGNRITSVMADLQTVYETRQKPVGGSQTFSGEAASASEPVAIDTEDAGNLLLRFADGARGSLHVSQTTAGRKNCLRWEIAGSQRSMSFNSEEPNSLWIGHRDVPNEHLLRDPSLMTTSAAEISQYPGGHNEGFPDTFKQLFRCFYDAIRDHQAGKATTDSRPGFATFADGHREILLCEAILKSHQQQRWVDVEEH